MLKKYKTTREPNGYYRIHQVPIFAEISREIPMEDGNSIEMNYDREWVDTAVKEANRRQFEQGSRPSIFIDDHAEFEEQTESLQKGQEDDRFVAAFLENQTAATVIYDGKPTRVVFADIVVTDKKVFDRMRKAQYPGISVEIHHTPENDPPTFTSASLLNTEPPAVKFPPLIPDEPRELVHFSEMKIPDGMDASKGFTGTIICFSETWKFPKQKFAENREQLEMDARRGDPIAKRKLEQLDKRKGESPDDIIKKAKQEILPLEKKAYSVYLENIDNLQVNRDFYNRIRNHVFLDIPEKIRNIMSRHYKEILKYDPDYEHSEFFNKVLSKETLPIIGLILFGTAGYHPSRVLDYKDLFAESDRQDRKLQTIVVPKDKAPSRKEAERIANRYGKSGVVRETSSSYRFRQNAPKFFDKDEYKTDKRDDASLVYSKPHERRSERKDLARLDRPKSFFAETDTPEQTERVSQIKKNLPELYRQELRKNSKFNSLVRDWKTNRQVVMKNAEIRKNRFNRLLNQIEAAGLLSYRDYVTNLVKQKSPKVRAIDEMDPSVWSKEPAANVDDNLLAEANKDYQALLDSSRILGQTESPAKTFSKIQNELEKKGLPSMSAKQLSQIVDESPEGQAFAEENPFLKAEREGRMPKDSFTFLRLVDELIKLSNEANSKLGPQWEDWLYPTLEEDEYKDKIQKVKQKLQPFLDMPQFSDFVETRDGLTHRKVGPITSVEEAKEALEYSVNNQAFSEKRVKGSQVRGKPSLKKDATFKETKPMAPEEQELDKEKQKYGNTFAEGEEESEMIDGMPKEEVEAEVEDLPDTFQSIFNKIMDWGEEKLQSLLSYIEEMSMESDAGTDAGSAEDAMPVEMMEYGEGKDNLMPGQRRHKIDNSPVAFSQLPPEMKVVFSEMNRRLDAVEKENRSLRGDQAKAKDQLRLESEIETKLATSPNRKAIKQDIMAVFSESGYNAAKKSLDMVSKHAMKYPRPLNENLSTPKVKASEDPVLSKYADNPEYLEKAEEFAASWNASSLKAEKTQEDYVDHAMKATFSELRSGIRFKSNQPIQGGK